MSQISISEASDLLKKLFDERIPVTAFLIGPSRVRFLLKGFVVGATKEQGLFVGDRLPPRDFRQLGKCIPFCRREMHV